METLELAEVARGQSTAIAMPLPAPRPRQNWRDSKSNSSPHRGACLTSFLLAPVGSRALKQQPPAAGTGPQSTPRLVGVIAHFTSPPTHPEVTWTQPPEPRRGPRPPGPPPKPESAASGRRNTIGGQGKTGSPPHKAFQG